MDDYRLGALLIAIGAVFPVDDNKRSNVIGDDEAANSSGRPFVATNETVLSSTPVSNAQRLAMEEYLRSAAWTLRQAGIIEMLCVIDDQGTFLQPLLEELRIQYIFASKTDEDVMLSACRNGLELMCNFWDACLFYPVNFPYLRSHTVISLLRAGVDDTRMVLRPAFRETAGYPCLIDCGAYNTLLIRDGDNVESILDCFAPDLLELPDSGSIKAIQTLSQYDDFLWRKQAGERPDPFACTAIWDYCGTSSRMWPHLNMVSDIAYQTALQLQQAGHSIDPELTQAGALLHGIAKGLPNAEWLGAQWLAALGYPAVANIVACSRDLPEDAIEALDERAIVYWADKLVRHNRSCTVDERFMHELELSAENPDRVLLILQRRNAARAVQKRIFERLGQVESFAAEDLSYRTAENDYENTSYTGPYPVNMDGDANVEIEVHNNIPSNASFLEVESVESVAAN